MVEILPATEARKRADEVRIKRAELEAEQELVELLSIIDGYSCQGRYSLQVQGSLKGKTKEALGVAGYLVEEEERPGVGCIRTHISWE